ncbi:MAG: twin-arginine translocation signal domain-containing protein [Planctomycetota bacterium]|jgi:hypothetical protein
MNELNYSRRDFLKAAGFGAVTIAMQDCSFWRSIFVLKPFTMAIMGRTKLYT